jgi:hypothetical protein
MHRAVASGSPPLSRMLEHLEQALLTGFVEAGPRGELVARAVLLLAADHACQRKGLADRLFEYGQVLTVGEYLSSLVGAANLATLKAGCGMDAAKLGRLLEGSMFLTHIVRARYRPSRKALLRFMARGAAVLWRCNEQGITIIIPVVLPDQGAAQPAAVDLIPGYKQSATDQATIPSLADTPAPAAPGTTTPLVQQQQQAVGGRSVICIDTSRVSFILVHVKNHESGGGDHRGDRARVDLCPSSCIADIKANGGANTNDANDDSVPWVGIWMQPASIQGQAAGVGGIPFTGHTTRNTEPEENMVGLTTDGVGLQTFPFLGELPSMSQAGQGMEWWLHRWSRVLRWPGWCVLQRIDCHHCWRPSCAPRSIQSVSTSPTSSSLSRES